MYHSQAPPDSYVQCSSYCKPKATYTWRGMLIYTLFSKKQTINVTSCSSSAVGIVSKVSNAPRTKIAPRTEANRLWHKVLVLSTWIVAGPLAQRSKCSMFSLARGTQWNTGPTWQLAGSHPVLIITMPWAAGSWGDRQYREPKAMLQFSPGYPASCSTCSAGAVPLKGQR